MGNSSSGIIEAGAINVDVVNVGPRQNGRERSRQVVDCPYGRAHVSRALDLVLTRERPRRPSRLYGDGRAGERIAAALGEIVLNEQLRHKRIVY